MKAVRLCGFDVNGFCDLSARNWDLTPGGEEKYGDEHISHGGLLGPVVRVRKSSEEFWVGGRQAEVAPHGRGAGWGDVGNEKLRLSIRALLDGRTKDPVALGAAFTGLARGARVNVAAIEEGVPGQEESQERILEALSTARVSNPLLVWRSVCAALYRIKSKDVAEHNEIGIISHASDGFSLQRLRILERDGRSGPIFAPERRSDASLVPSCLGYRKLASMARDALLEGEQFNAETEHRVRARSVGKLALGETPSEEVLRRFNGAWEVIDPPHSLELRDVSLERSDFDILDNCDEILIESLAAGSIRRAVIDACRRAIGGNILDLPRDAVARGALEAARRVSMGNPVYFDFLPIISTIVYSKGEAANFDLIDDSETLEAGRLYRSPKPAILALPARQENISIYIRKQAEPFPRKAVLSLGKPLSRDTPVSLFVEQKPASGRARIVLDAQDLGRQLTVDWDRAEDIRSSWEDLIASLDFKPSIPNRLVLKNSIISWEETASAPALFDLLEQNVNRDSADWASLSEKLAARPQQCYCISSDGCVPGEVQREHLDMLDRLTDRALAETSERLDGKRQDSNHALQFLTWQFRRCPESVADILLDCIEAREGKELAPPLVHHHQSWVLIYQGSARIIDDQTREKRILTAILGTDASHWGWRVETACLAILMSRSKTMPFMLDRPQLEILADRVEHEFKETLGSNYTKFHYAPFLLAGLLRHRLKEPRSLVLGSDPLADRLFEVVSEVQIDFDRKSPRSHRFVQRVHRYRPIVDDLARELQGEGTNPDLLLDIYSAG